MALYESLCVRDISIHSALRQQFVTKSLLSVQFVEPPVGCLQMPAENTSVSSHSF